MTCTLRGPVQAARIHAELKRKPTHVSESPRPLFKRQRAFLFEDEPKATLQVSPADTANDGICQGNKATAIDDDERLQVSSPGPAETANDGICEGNCPMSVQQTLEYDLDEDPLFDSQWRQEMWDEMRAGTRVPGNWDVLATPLSPNNGGDGAPVASVVN